MPSVALKAPLALLLVCASAGACKDRSPKSGEEPAAEPSNEVKESVSKPTTPPTPAPLTATPLVLFDASSGTGVAASASLDETLVSLRARATRASASESYRVDVVASLADKELVVRTCDEVKIGAAGRIELMLRGELLHVLCINPPQGQDLGWTDAVRLRFRADASKFEDAGSYSGEGIVDPDSIDLDEADIVDELP